jgi:hypothetical protein
MRDIFDDRQLSIHVGLDRCCRQKRTATLRSLIITHPMSNLPLLN